MLSLYVTWPVRKGWPSCSTIGQSTLSILNRPYLNNQPVDYSICLIARNFFRFLELEGARTQLFCEVYSISGWLIPIQ